MKQHDFSFIIDALMYSVSGGVCSVLTAFHDISKDVTIPSVVVYDGETWTVTEIREDAFADCSNLTSVTIPDSVTKIELYAFRGCRSLTSVTIPDSVTEIGEMAFSDCHSLLSVTIPDSVTEIGENTFADCSKLETVIVFRDTPLPVDEDIFKGVPLSEATLRVPSGTEDLYRAAPVWKDFGRIISAG